MQIDLKTVHYKPPEMRKKKGQQIAWSPEDIFMMQNMQAKTTGRHVKNNYYLVVRCTYSGCTCCSRLPLSRIPLTIVPVINPQCWNAPQQDFNPTVWNAPQIQF